MPISADIYKKIVSAKCYIDDHFEEAIDLGIISREACLSRFHFHRLFTRIYRTTPHRYLTRKRMDQARQLLASGELSVSEVCNCVGFESVGSFSVLFKKESGVAPQAYRSLALVKKQQALQRPKAFIPHCFIPGALQ